MELKKEEPLRLEPETALGTAHNAVNDTQHDDEVQAPVGSRSAENWFLDAAAHAHDGDYLDARLAAQRGIHAIGERAS